MQSAEDFLNLVHREIPFDLKSTRSHRHIHSHNTPSGNVIKENIKDKNSQPQKIWLAKGNLASVVGVDYIEKVRAPVYINIWTIGLDGSGNGGIKIPTERLHAWLEHLDHSIEHTVLDKTNLSDHVSLSTKSEKLAAKIDYFYQYRLIKSSPRVIDVLEHTLKMHHRKASSQQYHMDANEISNILEDLVHHCNLDDAYNVFILNPRFNWMSDIDISNYGYRTGFSDDEIEEIYQDKNLTEKIMSISVPLNPDLESQTTPSRPFNDAQLNKEEDNPSIFSSFADKSSSKATVTANNVILLSEEWANKVMIKTQEMVEKPGQTTSEYIDRLASLPHPPRITDIYNDYQQEDCLVDAWIGQKRTIWLDLSANPGPGKAHWGPIVGGETVRNNASFPSINIFASFQNVDKKEPKPDYDYNPNEYTWESIQAEKAVLEDRIAKYCNGDQPDKEQCELAKKLFEVMEDLESNEIDQDHKSKKSFEGIGAFSFFKNDKKEEGHLTHLETDHFLSHLSATLSSSLPTVFTPAVAHTPGELSTGYTKRVTFLLYILSNHNTYDPLGNDFLTRMHESLSELKLTQQKFSIVVHKLSMNDDPTLAASYMNALHTTVVPFLRYNGHFITIKRMFIDSHLLINELKRIDQREEPNYNNRGPESRDIPIFLFSLDYPLPVFIDTHFQSKALESMVIAVQSSRHLWESHLTCNGNPMYFNLRDPVRSIVASVAQLLGGLLPIHMKYSRAHKRVTEDWTWSVGSSPLSFTSKGYNFGQIQIDTLHRNYIISGIRHASSIVNQAVQTLGGAKTTPGNALLMNSATLWKLVFEQEVHDTVDQEISKDVPSKKNAMIFRSKVDENDIILLRRYHQFLLDFIVKLWEEMGNLEIELACSQLVDLLRIANEFELLVKSFVQKAKEKQCTAGGKSRNKNLFEWFRKFSGTSEDDTTHNGFGVGWYIVSGIICSLMIIRRITSRRIIRPKLN